jgi:hypothetical protein
MKTVLAAILAISLLAGCSNLAGKSAAYQAEHQRVFWASLNGGGMDGGAQAWANYRAHEAAEAKVGK